MRALARGGASVHVARSCTHSTFSTRVSCVGGMKRNVSRGLMSWKSTLRIDVLPDLCPHQGGPQQSQPELVDTFRRP